MKANVFMAGALILSFGLMGCKKKANAPPPPMVPAPAIPPSDQQSKEAEKEKAVYVYGGDRFRDPFSEAGVSTGYKEDAQFNPQQAKLKAVIFGSSLRSAVLSVSGGGSYFVKGERLFDIMGKTISGYQVKIFLEKVLITNEAQEVFELKLRETDEGEKKT